ncbi:MAG: lytic transglycosylase domain-containing protein [Streptosporangiaceae bacterium]
MISAFWRRAVPTTVATFTLCLSVAGLADPAAQAVITPGGFGGHELVSPAVAPAPPRISGSPGTAGAPPRQLFVPDLIAGAPGGITSAQLARISKLGSVLAVLPLDGGQVTVNGQAADVLGVSPQAFRAWTPPGTAAAAAVWSDLSQGELVSTRAAASDLGVSAGHAYEVTGAARETIPFGTAAQLSVRGADAVVNLARSAQLGLAKNFAVLINAPGADLITLMSEVRSVIGAGGHVVNLVSYQKVTPASLPVDANVRAGTPATFLELYQQSAAQYCPGLSWTVLAAINEIESGDGANDGPSTAGALGPMQFLPSTWAVWGIDGWGPPGPPDIMDALDAVPSAARLLCAPMVAVTPRCCVRPSSITTTRPGTSTRSSPSPPNTRRTIPDPWPARAPPGVAAGPAGR